MSRSLLAVMLAVGVVLAAVLARGIPGYAQSATGPTSDEFNNNAFVAPFQVICGQFATNCPDPQGPTTWSLNGERPGYLRIMTQFGSLVGGSSQASNNARNLVLQPAGNPNYTATTSLTFPGGTSSNVLLLGQTGGILVYQDDDHFIYLARQLTVTGQSEIQFLQENGTSDLVTNVPETGFFQPTVYLRIVRTGTLYEGFYSYDNQTFTPVAPQIATPVPTATSAPTNTPVATNTPSPTSVPGTPGTPSPTATATPIPTNTPVPTGYVANYASPQVGVFAWGGTNAAVTAAQIPADFDWFRVGANSQTPGPTVTPTNTAVASSTAVPTSTNTPAPTATNTPAPTATPVPTAKPKPAPSVSFQYVSIWYHFIHQGDVEHLQVQAKQHSKHGLWVNVHFATGKHLDYYVNTDNHGFWQTTFRIPGGAISQYSPQAVVTFQLWKGKASAKTFDTFVVLS